MSEIMVFESTALDVIEVESARWLRGAQIAQALGFRNPQQAVKDLYHRNKDEFTSDMTLVMELPTPGGPQLVRLFNARGAALLAMLARTERAGAFRAWVLDVLEGRQAPDSADVLRQQRDLAAAELMKARPLWAAIVRYRRMGLGRAEICRLVGRKAEAVRRALRALEALGLVDPDPHLAKQRAALAVRPGLNTVAGQAVANV